MKKRHHGLPLDTDSLFDNAKQPSHSGEVLHNVLTLKLMSFISFLSSTLGVLPKIPFKLTQSIPVALQKSWNFNGKLLKLVIF